MQLVFPGIKIWLDVDYLSDLSELEKSVSLSTVFLLYYSKNYFRSKNCRKELYKAFSQKKPIIIIYEGNSSVVDEMEQECLIYCSEDIGNNVPDIAKIMNKLFSGDDDDKPILWLKDGQFCAAALKCIYQRILFHFPHYKKHPSFLERGIFIPNEQEHVILESEIDVLVSQHNHGCMELALELQSIQHQKNKTSLVNIVLMCGNENHSNEVDDNTISIGGKRSLVAGELQQSPSSGEYKVIPNTFSSSEADGTENNSNEDNNIGEGVRLISDKEVPLSLPEEVNPKYLLLYLNKDTFCGLGNSERRQFESLILKCIKDPKIKIILVQEKEVSKGGCGFSTLQENFPEILYNPPNNLFNDLTIPLYGYDEYRFVSLSKIMLKMGAVIPKRRKCCSQKLELMRKEKL